MEHIFHEKQEGSLCGQHCLNALLQGAYFTAVDLAELAQNLDDAERARMAESGVDSDDYRRFIEQPSGNMDDSGYFSVQVINSALAVFGLESVPYNSTEPRAVAAQAQPEEMNAFICNYRDHWFTIRHLGNQWFNLNSLLSGPELISNTYLAMFLAQLQNEGYSIFVVFGDMLPCLADESLLRSPAVQTQKPKLCSLKKQDNGQLLQHAMRKSLAKDDRQIETIVLNDSDDEDEEIRQALKLSLQSETTSRPLVPELDPAELRQRRLAYLDKAAAKINT